MSNSKVNGRDVLLAFALKYNNDWQKIYDAIKNKEELKGDILDSNDKYLASLKAKGWKCISLIDKDYPEILKHVNKIPFVVFTKDPKNIINSDLDGYSFCGFAGGKTLTNLKTENLNPCDVVTSNAVLNDFLSEDCAVGGYYVLTTDQFNLLNSVNKAKNNYLLVEGNKDAANSSKTEALEKKLNDNSAIISLSLPEHKNDNPVCDNPENAIAMLAKTLVLLPTLGVDFKKAAVTYTINLALQAGGDVLAVPNGLLELHNTGLASFSNQLLKDGATLVDTSKSLAETLVNNQTRDVSWSFPEPSKEQTLQTENVSEMER